jgi:predicted RNA binding protein with dsRBD fold (UPF0201 family)
MARHPHSNEAPLKYARRLRELLERKGELEKARAELPSGSEGEEQRRLLDQQIARVKAQADDLSL